MSRKCFVENHIYLFVLISLLVIVSAQVPDSSTNWIKLLSADGIRFGARNGMKADIRAFLFLLRFLLVCRSRFMCF
jgi:hypothetical protein